MVQLSTEQRVFVVTTYTLTQSVTEVQNAFRIRFPDRNPPNKKTILKNFRRRVRLFGRSGSYKYSAIHVQFN